MAGQINMDSEFGKIIFEYARNTEYKSYLEIGTWNGEGSTNCFIQGLKLLVYYVNKDCKTSLDLGPSTFGYR